MSALKLERDIYQMLDGDYVVKAVWTFHHESFICFVTEFMIGGDFNKLLDQVGRFEEDQARFYFAELVLAIESLHNLGIVHRDLKPDNMLMDAKGHIRLTDFGLSQKGLNKQLNNNNATPNSRRASQMFSPTDFSNLLMAQRVPSFFDEWNKKTEQEKSSPVKKSEKAQETIFGFLNEEHVYSVKSEKKPCKQRRMSQRDLHVGQRRRSIVGTPDYMAPEILSPDKLNGSAYNEKAMDWWSMGIILYQFLVGVPPFCDTTVDNVFDNIRNYRIEWPSIGNLLLYNNQT